MNQNVRQAWWPIRAASTTGVPEAEVSTDSARSRGWAWKRGKSWVMKKACPRAAKPGQGWNWGWQVGWGVCMCTSVPEESMEMCWKVGADGTRCLGSHQEDPVTPNRG